MFVIDPCYVIYRILTFSTDGRIRIENLKPNTNYTLSVRAKNEVGVGEAIPLTVATETISTYYCRLHSKVAGYLLVRVTINSIFKRMCWLLTAVLVDYRYFLFFLLFFINFLA